MHDRQQADRIRVAQGWTDLEALLFRALEPYFKVCARSHVKLSRELQRRLPAGYETRGDIIFFQHKRPWYRQWSLNSDHGFKVADKECPRHTAAYLVRLESLWENGPEFLAAFGMGGIETLVWTRRLRHDFSHLLEGYGLTMVEMAAPNEEEARPVDLSFAENWRITPILTHEIVC